MAFTIKKWQMHLGVAASPSTREEEAGGSGLQGHPQLHMESEASLGTGAHS